MFKITTECVIMRYF